MQCGVDDRYITMLVAVNADNKRCWSKGTMADRSRYLEIRTCASITLLACYCSTVWYLYAWLAVGLFGS